MAGNLFDENSAASARDPLRWCKSGQHQTKVINQATGEKFCMVCKTTIRTSETTGTIGTIETIGTAPKAR